MPITVTCRACYRTFRVSDRHAGRRGRCPDCGAVVDVPPDDLPRLEPIDDTPLDVPDDPPRPARPRRPHRPPPSPRDHLPAWRRVATGFLVQQAGATLSLIAVALILVAGTVLAPAEPDPDGEPDVPQMVAAGLGMLAAVLGVGLQAIGRFTSAGTPVRGPRAPGWASALITAAQVPVGCGVGLFAAMAAADQQQGNPNPAAVALFGLGIVGWTILVVSGEVCHGFAVGSVGRVLRADGLKAFGRGLGVFVIFAGFLGIVSLAVLGALTDDQNPNAGPNPDDEQLAQIWLIGVSVLLGLYLVLDVVLLQAGRAAIARIAAADSDGPAGDDDWR